MVAHRPINLAVKIFSTGLGFGLQHDGSARLIGTKGRRFHLDLLNDLYIRRYRSRSRRVHIRDRGAVTDNLRQVKTIAVHAIGAGVGRESRSLAAVCVDIEIARIRRARHQAEQFDGAAAHNGQVLHLLGGERVGQLARVLGRNGSLLGRYRDRLARGFHGQLNVGNLEVVGNMYHDGSLQLREAGLLVLRLIGSGGETGE